MGKEIVLYKASNYCSPLSPKLEVLMPFIRDIAQQALSTNLLTLEAEDQLRQLLQQTKYGEEDFLAFMKLQYAVMCGSVTQESRLRLGLEYQ